MRVMQLRRFVLVVAFALLPSWALAANFEVQAQNGNELGWSAKADCEALASANCTSAYFCSNEIWMATGSFDAVQQRRYDGQQLVIVKDGAPICAVN